MTRTHFRVRQNNLGIRHVLKKGNWGPTLGVIQTGSQNQRNPNAPTFEERSVEWTLSMKEKQGEQLGFYTGTKVPGSCSENRNKFFKPRPASNASSPSKTVGEVLRGLPPLSSIFFARAVH